MKRTLEEAQAWLLTENRMEKINARRALNNTPPDTLENASKWLQYWTQEEMDNLSDVLEGKKRIEDVTND